MNSATSDASTSTDDLPARPLCLFYFPHPFGVLSAEPPVILNMSPPASATTPSPSPVDASRFFTNDARVSYDLGNATVHKKPLTLISVTEPYPLHFTLRSESLASSVFSSDIWFGSSPDSRGFDHARKLVPFTRVLPPLRLPTPRESSAPDSSEDVWPSKRVNPEKISLPPIDLPKKKRAPSVNSEVLSVGSVETVRECSGARAGVRRARRVRGVRKVRGGTSRQLSGVRRTLTTLMQRALREGAGTGLGAGGVSPALRHLLGTVRDAWSTPRPLLYRDYIRKVEETPGPSEQDRDIEAVRKSERVSTMVRLAGGDASPGLLRRRYSVPETVMRRYRLAQQNSDYEDGSVTTAPSGAASPAAPASPPHLPAGWPPPAPCCMARADRELMRKSALLRRLWGRAPPVRTPSPHNGTRSCACCSPVSTRSLHSSRSELRPLAHRPLRRSIAPRTPALALSDCGDREADSASTYRSHQAHHTRSDLPSTPLSASRTATEDFSSLAVCESYTAHATASDVYVGRDRTSTTDISSESTTAPMTLKTGENSSESSTYRIRSDSVEPFERSMTDTSESLTLSTSIPTMQEARARLARQVSRPEHFDVHVNETSEDNDNEDKNILPIDSQSSIEPPPYEVLEIIVSETYDPLPNREEIQTYNNQHTLEKFSSVNNKNSSSNKCIQNFDLDEYVSNILVESLNSLTDQLESMNASIGSERKISIVEKEIKVKLQNTGVNTIVHLSPTSNNQIIFGNEELCNRDERAANHSALEAPVSLFEVTSAEPSAGYSMEHSATTAADTPREQQLQHDAVNHAMMQQIQKLFQHELNEIEHDIPNNEAPGISHIEISNVDVYIHNNKDCTFELSETIEVQTERTRYNDPEPFVAQEIIGGVGAGNYYSDPVECGVVPRLSAYPHTTSMEVNTSTSDVDLAGSDCASLVDSLDDPNSPRSLLLRRAYKNPAPAPAPVQHLARSTIDVLELLPESTAESSPSPLTHSGRERGEAFFIRIEDDAFGCERGSLVVAEHFPERLRQRLLRRHRSRQQRLERARSRHATAARNSAERPRQEEITRAHRQIDRECGAIVLSLVDEVIAKIAQEEYRNMRIKHRPKDTVVIKSNEDLSSIKRNRKKDVDLLNDLKSFKVAKSGAVQWRDEERDGSDRREKRHVRGKLSLQTRAPPHISASSPDVSPDATPEDGPRRVYQKSEFRDGSKCIEILEILEYVDMSQSSPEANNSDDSQNGFANKRKSRIPIPTYERVQRTSKPLTSKIQKSPTTERGYDLIKSSNSERTNRLIASMLLDSFNGNEDSEHALSLTDGPVRRASVPQQEGRSRSNSLRFKQIFDIIPEEKSSLSIESSNEDINYNRRVSEPNLPSLNRESGDKNKNLIGSHEDRRNQASPKHKDVKVQFASNQSYNGKCGGRNRLRTKDATTSPLQRPLISSSTGDSPGDPRATGGGSGGGGWRHTTAAASRGSSEDAKQKIDESERETIIRRETKTTATQYEVKSRKQRTGRTTEGAASDTMIVGKDKNKSRKDKTPPRGKSEDRKRYEERNKLKKAKKDCYERTKDRKMRQSSMIRSASDPLGTAFSGDIDDRRRDCREGSGSSSSGESSGLLCALAPRWLAAAHRRRRRDQATPAPLPPKPAPPAANPAADSVESKPAAPCVDAEQVAAQSGGAGAGRAEGSWSVTVMGAGRANPPADVEMRLRFPPTNTANNAGSCQLQQCNSQETSRNTYQECQCRHCASCTCSSRPRHASPPPRPALPARAPSLGDMTLALKNESSGSSILASKSTKKSSDSLPLVETYRASKTKTKSSVKTRRACSLHCWLPPAALQPLRVSRGLSVCGSAIVPERKPPAPTATQRDVTRLHLIPSLPPPRPVCPAHFAHTAR